MNLYYMYNLNNTITITYPIVVQYAPSCLDSKLFLETKDGCYCLGNKLQHKVLFLHQQNSINCTTAYDQSDWLISIYFDSELWPSEKGCFGYKTEYCRLKSQ